MANDAPIRQCLNCGKELKGRADMKFCNDQCRSDYNNKLKREEKDVYHDVITILKNNRRILFEVMPKRNARSIFREDLLKTGYKLEYCTQREHFQFYDYIFCFDQGLKIMDENRFEYTTRQSFEMEVEMFHYPPNNLKLVDPKKDNT